MILVPFHLSLTVTAALAVFALGFTAWLHNRWSRGTVVFALMSFSLALWTAVGWFHSLELSALPSQVTLWRYLFYLGVALAPALALHTSALLEKRPFHATGWMSYTLSLAIFVIIDSAFFLRAYMPHSSLGPQLLNVGSILGLLFYVVVFYIISIQLYPLAHSMSAERLERRRGLYGLVLLVIYLAAGALQFVTITWIPSDVLMTILGIAFFTVASIGFVRVSFLEVSLASLEVFFIVLVSGVLVSIMRAGDFFEALVTLFGGLVVALFGVRAVRAVRDEASRRQELELINQELKVLDEAKSEFVALIAHQLRSPLGGIRFASDMLVHGDYGELSAGAKKVVGLMKQTAERLLSLAETSLNAARFDVGAFQMLVAPVDVALEIKMLLDEASLFAKAKGLELISRVDTLPKRINFDREVLRNVVFNLVDNAIKYTDKGQVTVEANIHHDLLLITVSDTGAGLTAQDKKNLFRRFYRGHMGQKHQYQGAGLGLYVTKKMVEAANGTITLASEGLGKGTTFRLEFPVDEPRDSQVR